MKKTIILSSLLLFVVVFVATVTVNAFAQNSSSSKVGIIPVAEEGTVTAEKGDVTTVQAGNRMWKMYFEAQGDGVKWKELLKVKGNEALNDMKRYSKSADGRERFEIYPGEKVFGLVTLKTNLNASNPDDANGVILVTDQIPASSGSIFTSDWFWFVTFLVFCLVAYALSTRRGKLRGVRQNRSTGERETIVNLDADPVTAGPPVVEGGATQETAPDLFRQRAQAEFEAATGVRLILPDIILERLARGKMNGTLITGFREGPDQVINHKNTDGFKARVRLPNGEISTMYSVAQCFNPVRYQGAHRFTEGENFTFEETEVLIAGPEDAQAETADSETQHAGSPAQTQQHLPQPNLPLITENTVGVLFNGNNMCTLIVGGTVLPFAGSNEVAIRPAGGGQSGFAIEDGGASLTIANGTVSLRATGQLALPSASDVDTTDPGDIS
jgi:hypothetical protein